MAEARGGDCQRLLGSWVGGRNRNARRQAGYDSLGVGATVSGEVSESEVDAGVDGHGGSQFLLRRRSARGAGFELVSGGKVLRARDCAGEREGIADRNPAGVAGRV